MPPIPMTQFDEETQPEPEPEPVWLTLKATLQLVRRTTNSLLGTTAPTLLLGREPCAYSRRRGWRRRFRG